LSVDRPLDLEQPVDPADRFQRQRRDHRRLLALSLATRILGQIHYHEERTPGVHPTGRLQDRPKRAAGFVELAIAAIGIGLEIPLSLVK
jgi:hypothetical protein